MKLVASMIAAPVEVDRYLIPCVRSLLCFCDEVALLLDGDWPVIDFPLRDAFGSDSGRVPMRMTLDDTFFAHEGRARQTLLDFTLDRAPTHVLAIDADEFVSDGQALRRAIETPGPYGAWNLCMQEVWKASEDGLRLRSDGRWVERDVPILYAVDALSGPLTMPNKALASGRTPTAVAGARTGHSCSAILHFGWTNEQERAARYARYVKHDGGRFHAGSHLASIMDGDETVRLTDRGWPDELVPFKDAILAHAGVSGSA